MVSNTSKYAIRALIYLALYAAPEKKKGLKDIAANLGIPTPFLGKILQVLARHNILDSSKGPHGGFCTARDRPSIFPSWRLSTCLMGKMLFSNVL